MLGAAVVGALLVAATFVVAGMIGQRGPDGLGGLFGGERQRGSPAATAATQPPATGQGDGDGQGDGGAGFRCETQTVSAAEPGSWTVVRARWGQRSGFDYISFVLRRGGDSDATAAVTAELLPTGDVDGRFGLDPPASGDAALVVTFADPVRLSGPFGRTTNQRALREFRLERGDESVYAVLGVTGSGCFEMSAPDWADGSPRNVELTLRIERE